MNKVFRLAFLIVLTTGVAKGQTRAVEKEKPDFSRWEKEIAAFEQRDKTNPPPKNALLFVGSSSIRLWNLSKSFPGMATINRGFGGSQLADSVHFAPRIVLKYEPRLIVLYAGDNDIAAGKTPEQVGADFRDFVRTVHKKLPKTRIVFLAIKPSIQRWRLIDSIKKANALIAAECKKGELVSYLDVATPMLGRDGKPRSELFAKDGLHLNEKGYALWASILMPILKERP
ncbi:MAG TPA: SGNH/GDSL hydrolase family protein [Gemmataceae bacterium]|nr:SGNH/GDSL hydrolase family protein [Gemmataceae bacterium]